MKINGYPNYEIHSDGTVIGARGKELKFDYNSTGYARVTLSKWGIPRRKFVHRLVAEHFVAGWTPWRRYVNHIDGDRTNNDASNLEWVTASENVKDGWKRGRDSSHLYKNFGRD